MTQHDQLHRYLFENYAVRGELVTVSETLEQILANHSYPRRSKPCWQSCSSPPAC